MTCPGSYQACQASGDSPPSKYSAAGSVAHRLAEYALDPTAPDVTGEMGSVVTYDGFEVLITPEMFAAVDVFRREVEARMTPGCLHAFETRVDLSKWWRPGEAPPPVPMFGTADAWIYSPFFRRLSVIDFKYGSGVFVSAVDNPQLLYYAAGVLLALPPRARADLREVELVVVQPRAAGMAPVRTQTVHVLDLCLWVANDLKPAVERVTEPDAPLVPGAHCRFCGARRGCPALAEQDANAASERAREAFAASPLPDDFNF
jgi:hypothetical protein